VVVPAPVARYLSGLKKDTKQSSDHSIQKISTEELKSFGAFLGSFANPPTPAQAQLLSQWNVLVLNPLEDGVADAVPISTSKHILGRLDVRTLVNSEDSSSTDDVIHSIARIAETLKTYFQGQSYTGVLLANFQSHFQPPVVTEIAKYINGFGLDLWLEMAPPAYLTEREGRDINMEFIRGIICRNGTIRTDGDRQNYFQMTEMREAMRMIAAQRVLHGPPIMMWETVDDDAQLDYAVVQRSFNWCRYNTTLCWIGHASALIDADIAAENTVAEKPLGALMWLKNEETMKSHDIWRENNQISRSSCGHDNLYDSLDSFIPDLSTKLRLLPPTSAPATGNIVEPLNSWGSQHYDNGQTDPLATTSSGESFTGLGCFQLGLEVTPKAFADLVQGQRRLRDLELLQIIKDEELNLLTEQFQTLYNAERPSTITPAISRAVKELLCLLTTVYDDGNPSLQVYSGLHSGFQTGSDVQFWGLYDYDTNSRSLSIYLSNFTEDKAGTILHTFLSSRGFSRTECFWAELALSEVNGTLSETWDLPPRIVKDVEKLSPAETILLLRRLILLNHDDDSLFLERIRAVCEYQLMEVPTLTQLRALNSTAYLRGEVSAADLVTSRLDWLRAKGCAHPDISKAISLFEEVDTRLYDVLMTGQSEVYAQIGSVVQSILQKDQIDAGADIFALAVFSAFRKLAMDEIYLEVLDRNPYPNHATDQPGCFAENFALGSRCESFFDTTPRVVGRIISDRYRAYYMKHQPPLREEQFTELPTAYAAMQVDMDPTDGQERLPQLYQITFLGIFALPALIDIMLLTTIGRGLYLTTFMTSSQKTMATTALMLALLACGAIGSWITSGGSYYLYASAFPAMNMFILTRFVAGIAVALVGGLGGLVAVIVTKGVGPGFVFFFYFMMLTTYLMTLSALSIYQLPGSKFQSGRTVIMTCIPILFISPVLSLFVQHDIAVYFCVLTTFVISLLFGARKVMAQWATFYLSIPFVTDKEVVDWYIKTRGAGNSTSDFAEDMKDIGTTPYPRSALHAAVLKECNRNFWTKATSDPLVAKLAEGYASTKFLMTWYCRHKRTQMPLPYTPTWNLTLKAGLENMTNTQKGKIAIPHCLTVCETTKIRANYFSGLKLHSAFLHWRHTGADIWSGLLYFVVALLDKWAALVCGGGLVGLSAAGSEEYRLAVGFGLCYYLIGAVSLDAVSQPLWTAANENTITPINSLKFLRQATKKDVSARQRLYWTSLAKFFFLHIWAIVITCSLMWIFEASRPATIMYLSYIGAYTGLLWYQYNKIYCGTHAAKCLATAAIIGLPIGIALHQKLPDFAFSGVISLAVGTWIAAIHSLFVTKIGWPRLYKSKSTATLGAEDDADVKGQEMSYSCSSLEPYPELSQTTLSKTFESICTFPSDDRYTLDPSQHSGSRIVELLLSQCTSARSEMVQDAFPSAEQLIRRTVDLWKSGKVVVEIVSARHFGQQEQELRTVSRKVGDNLHVFIILPVDVDGFQSTLDIHRNNRIIAEAIVQTTSEALLGLSHDHAMLAKLLALDQPNDNVLSIPEGIKRQLENSATERNRVTDNGDKTLLRYLTLGLDCDIEWDNLPREIRHFLLKRCCEQCDPLSAVEESWIRSNLCATDDLNVEEYVARCNLGANFTVAIRTYARAHSMMLEAGNEEESAFSDLSYEKLLRSPPSSPYSGLGFFSRFLSGLRRRVQLCVKFLVLSLVADPEYQRELNYMTRTTPLGFHWPVTIFLNGIWSFCKMLQRIIIPLALFHKREKVKKLHSKVKGMKIVVQKHRIMIESLSGPSTCFVATQVDGSLQLSQYKGVHDQEPSESKQLLAVNTYTDKLVLRQREEYRGQKIANQFIYAYPEGGKGLLRRSGSKLPFQRECVKGDLQGQIVLYDNRGYITKGSMFRGVNPVNFTYWYRRNAKFEDELLRGEFIFPHLTVRVSWSMPPRNHPDRLDEWIPFTKVTEATFIQVDAEGLPEIYHASWTYEHKFHPEIDTTLNGEPVATPPMIREDWFKVLSKPDKCGFLSDNPLLSFTSAKSNFVSRALGLNMKRYPMSTSQARNQLWKAWRHGKHLDAITARWIDEGLLRSDSILDPYWRNRDIGFLDTAKEYLDMQADTIMARVDMDPDVSSWVHIAFKISDFYSFGQGGDSTINTRTLYNQIRDTDEELHILAMDTSTWPNEPGGVSACRRDMVNDLKTIKWHIVAESANDYGVPRFQIERNVQSLTILPLWGLDFLNPTHGIFKNSLDSAVVERSHDTRTADIEKHFIPILTSLVNCSRTLHLTRKHVEEATRALVDLNTYFESRNWNDVWNSEIVKQTWRELWLSEELADSLKVSEWWDFEKPTILQLDQALNMWHRYLFIFSIPVPEKITDVFQASHHFTGATYGILCKVKRQCTLQVWDHCISFREFTTFMSSAVSFDTPFVNSSLISLGYLSCVLLEHHADVVLPCAAYFNPGWEVELGSAEGVLEHRRTFARKIDPVVNGICNMEKFEPIKKIKTETPTVVMLSHIQYVKDIKNAIMATDLIVNKWGFKDYRLHVYGDMERAAGHATECQELIASKGLRDHCVLKGLGNPSLVLQDAWVFLNSSISEGLPLAMGEAALTGVPVVCTDVGASFCVVTDLSSGERFSEVVPPNDAESLARAQISIMGLLDKWAIHAQDAPRISPPVLSYPNPSPEEVQQITQRMYEKTEQRRALGMMGRDNVLKNFSSERYLREHEQMLWIGKLRSRNYHIRRNISTANSSSIGLSTEKLIAPRRNPRLTPESWISLNSQLEKKRGTSLYSREIRPSTLHSSVSYASSMYGGHTAGEVVEVV
jgi:glycosyltransferase involved in cell wall biosynthesis